MNVVILVANLIWSHKPSNCQFIYFLLKIYGEYGDRPPVPYRSLTAELWDSIEMFFQLKGQKQNEYEW